MYFVLTMIEKKNIKYVVRGLIILLLGTWIDGVYGQHVGLDFYKYLSELPYISDNNKAYYMSSYDRSGGNDDGRYGTYSDIYIDENNEHVIFEEDGPGCIYNIWFTGSNMSLHWDTIKFYFDREKSPRITYKADSLFSGLNIPFIFPMVTNAYISSGGYSSSIPIPFNKHLKITTVKKVQYYNIYYHLYKNQNLKSWNGQEDYKQLIDIFNNCSKDPKRIDIVDEVSKTVKFPISKKKNTNIAYELFSLKQSGIVQYIKIRPLATLDTYKLNHIYISIYYDEQIYPAVNAPIGHFFGSGLGGTEVKSILIGMSSSEFFYCYFPIPFKKSIRIFLYSKFFQLSAEFLCKIGYTACEVPEEINSALVGYFGTQYNKAFPILERQDYHLFKYTGEGAVVGQIMTVIPYEDNIKWWEGDMRIYIDGEATPRFHGTGHEDEYQGGWADYWLKNPYSLPLFGEPKTIVEPDNSGYINGATTVYRFWPGKIPFKKSISISTEHGNQNITPANYSSLVYYYFIPNKTTVSSENIIPEKYYLSQNYPNPFNLNTNIECYFPEMIDVKLDIYNLAGQLVKNLFNQKQANGFYHINWNGTNNFEQEVASGVYLYKLQTGRFSKTKKMILLR